MLQKRCIRLRRCDALGLTTRWATRRDSLADIGRGSSAKGQVDVVITTTSFRKDLDRVESDRLIVIALIEARRFIKHK